ncbi:MAG: hypothetical protein ABJ246_20875 [Paracoccaceae bacterium]
MMSDSEIDEKPKKPVIALMGEFSAGKSTLANLLLEQNASPVQVTATQLPPVWYSQGLPNAERVCQSGMHEPLPLKDWSQVQPENTEMVSVTSEADFLGACDLIDMPGTSDPNMAPDIWERFLPKVDCVIWCTPANQAWRQSEAALWEMVPPKLWDNSLLLLTRMDKMLTDRDRSRVLLRVRREADSLFRDVLPIALQDAIAACDDQDALQKTGATPLLNRIGDVLESLDKHPLPAFKPIPIPRQSEHPTEASNSESDLDAPVKIVPRRFVRDPNRSLRPRPESRMH